MNKSDTPPDKQDTLIGPAEAAESQEATPAKPKGTLHYIPDMEKRISKNVAIDEEKIQVAAILEAFADVNVTDFLPPLHGQQYPEYLIRDTNMRLRTVEDYWVNMTVPSLVGSMFRELDIKSGQKILDVGSASGFTTALLAHLVGSEGHVIGVEIHPELAEQGRANIPKYPDLEQRISFIEEDAALLTRASIARILGSDQESVQLFDRIFTAIQVLEIPAALTDLLAEGGKMIICKQKGPGQWYNGDMKIIEKKNGEILEHDTKSGMGGAFKSFMRKDETGRYFDIEGKESGK